MRIVMRRKHNLHETRKRKKSDMLKQKKESFNVWPKQSYSLRRTVYSLQSTVYRLYFLSPCACCRLSDDSERRVGGDPRAESGHSPFSFLLSSLLLLC